MIKLTKNYLSIFVLAATLLGCADTRVSWQARDKGCVVPSANRAFLEIMQIQPTGTTRDVVGIFKYAGYVFKKSILDLNDRCTHSKLIVDKLNNGADHVPYRWSNKNNNTKGKIIIFSTREYAKKVCRDYYSYITSNDKKNVWKGTACIGTRDSLSPVPDLLSRVGYWHFYNFYDNQAGSNPVKNDFMYAFSNPQTEDIRRKLFKFHCSRNPSRCR